MTVPNPGMMPVGNAGDKGASTSGKRDAHDPHKPPEAVRYLLLAWAVMIGAELVHQLFGVAMALLDPTALMESAREANKSVGGAEAVSDDQVKLIVYIAIVLMGLFALAVVLLLALALKAIARRKKWAQNATMLLMVFSGFFLLRMITVFLVVGANTDGIPTAVVALDGIIQIIAGVAGICGLIFAQQDEAKKWIAKQDAKGGRGHHNDSSPV